VGPTMNVKPQLHEAAPVWKSSADKNMSFYVRASRYRGLLHFVACRVLGNPDTADIAVENCLLVAFRRVRAFDCEGAFRSWLVRIAIDEALAILHRRGLPDYRREPGAARIRTASFSSEDELLLGQPPCNW
jgi:DNA-directed RNA polymerase specialized sigma24 family protein